jgi:hypothetical protein
VDAETAIAKANRRIGNESVETNYVPSANLA